MSGLGDTNEKENTMIKDSGGGGPFGGNGGGGGEVADVQDAPELSEALIWKARAQEAQSQLGACHDRIEALEAELARAQEKVAMTERRAMIERELTAAQAIDLETAHLLTEAAISEMDEPDVAIAVRELRARKPFLFVCEDPAHKGRGSSAMSAFERGTGSDDDLGDLAHRARSSGDRNELLRYLRARRRG